MSRDDTSHDGGDANAAATRRRFLAAVGAGGTAGLAGCLENLGGAGGGGGSESVTYGVISPMTGPYGGLATGQRNGAKLAIDQVSESDDIDVEMTGTYGDTEADATVGQQVARRAVNQDGASFLMGAISSSVALSLNEFAQEEGVLYNPGGAAVPITGENCNEYVFRAETNTAQVAEAVSAYTVNELGTKVWFHIADYPYGESVLNRVRSRMRDARGDVDVVGVSRSQLGATNFDSYVSDIGNSDAEVAVLGMTGGDLINFVRQAAAAGLKDAVTLMSPTMTFQVVRNALGADAYGTYGGIRYIPSLDTGDNQAFVSAYRDRFGSDPDNFARVAYESIRMTARGIDAAGSTDPADVIDQLAGMEMPTIFGQNEFRACDHQATNPTWMGRLDPPESGEAAAVEPLSKVEGEDAILPCAETGCSL